MLVTRYVLPNLMPHHLPAPDLPRTGALLQGLMAQAPRLRWLLLALMVIMVAVVALHADRIWNRSISALNPVPRAEQLVDEALRRDLGASDLRYLAVLSAPDTEQALQQAERASRLLSGLVRDGAIASFSSPSQVLPSLASQQARQAALPEPAALRQRLDAALHGMPLKAERLQGFLADVERSRTRAPLTRADLEGTASALLVDSLLIRRGQDVLVLLPLRPRTSDAGEQTVDIERVDATLKAGGVAGATVVDLLAETNALFDSYLREALVFSGLGCLAILALLLLMLRSIVRTLRVALPLVCAVVCVTGVLLLGGTSLTILHLVGLLLVVAIGSNYALFFDSANTGGSAQDERRTIISLATANLTIVGSFGMLAVSSVPVLAILGTTVGLGTVLALVVSAALARRAP